MSTFTTRATLDIAKETFKDVSLIIAGNTWLYANGDIKDGHNFNNNDENIMVTEDLEALFNRELSKEENEAMEYYSNNNNWHFWPGDVFEVLEDGILQQQIIGLFN